MSNGSDRPYPDFAYAPDGRLWWELKSTPGGTRAFGDEQKIAAWLASAIGQGGIFTMRDLRAALGEADAPNSAEHLNRRLRTLRIRDGWRIPSAKDDGSLEHDQYRVEAVGWHPGLGIERPAAQLVSDKVRRQVFERDKHMCVICGAVSGETYDDLPTRKARLTLGHRVPGKRLSSTATVDELQTECARCNESVRDELFDPVTLPELIPTVRGLSRADKAQLLAWLEAGRRSRSRLETVFADARRLNAGEIVALMNNLRIMTRAEHQQQDIEGL